MDSWEGILMGKGMGGSLVQHSICHINLVLVPSDYGIFCGINSSKMLWFTPIYWSLVIVVRWVWWGRGISGLNNCLGPLVGEKICSFMHILKGNYALLCSFFEKNAPFLPFSDFLPGTPGIARISTREEFHPKLHSSAIGFKRIKGNQS